MSILLSTGIFNQRAATSSYLLDTYSGAIAAFSLRQLKTGETTPTRITNSSGSTEADYTVSDIDAGLTAIGANTGTLAKWYDQANANDVLQTVLASQPIIKNAGTMQTLNGKPAINNTADFGLKTAGTVNFNAYSELWFFFVVGAPSGTNNVLIETSSNFVSAPGSMIMYFPSNTKLQISERTGGAGSDYSGKEYNVSVAAQNLITVKVKTLETVGNGSQLWINGVEITSYTVPGGFAANTSVFTAQVLNMFSRNANSIPYQNKVQEMICFGGDQSSNRAGIEAEINAYYSIY